MTLTFENDSDIIVYASEKIISFARENQYLFVANWVWWISGIIGLDTELTNHIDNLRSRKARLPRENCETKFEDPALIECTISTTLRDLTKDQRTNLELDKGENGIEEIKTGRNTWLRNRVHPSPQSKKQLNKARKVQRLHEASRKEADEWDQRLKEITAKIIQNFSKE
jgi:hypothetical protein